MSCVPCGNPCSSVSKDDVDRWTNSLKYVLANQTATKMFENYLHTRKLDSIDNLKLWNMCNDLLNNVHNKKIKDESTHIKDKYSEIVDLANDVEGLTEHQLRLMEQTKSKEPKQMLSLIEKLRQTVYEQMQDDYELFRNKLLKDYKVMKK